MYRNLLLFTALICSIFSSCEQKNQSESNEKSFLPKPHLVDSIIDGYISDGLYPFIYARLEGKNGEVLYEHGNVNEDIHPDLTVDGQTWIRVWSMSKIVTISVALDLIEEGVLKFEDAVEKYIPEFENLMVATVADGALATIEREKYSKICPYNLVPNDSTMTVLHLINHEAGFYYAVTGISCLDSLLAMENLPTSRNTDEFLSRIAKMPLIQHPGTTSFYGINTTILGMVAERATGKSLNQLVKERITDPMKISGLQYGLPEGINLIPSVSGKDTLLRKAHPGELDIFGPDVPDYDPEHQLYLGGEGMLATADGYADFLRMLLNHGILNDHRFLETSTVEDIYAPHTQLDNPYGYNGYNLWISGDSMRIKGQGDAGLWIGGGYEATHFWVDPKREFIGVIMSQMSFATPKGYGRDDAIRGEIYRQLFESESE